MLRWTGIAIWLLAIVLILDAEISWFSTCYEANHHPKTHENSIKNCSIRQGPFFRSLVRFANAFEDHGEAVIAAFTIILAISTGFLWAATNRSARAAEKAAEHIPAAERAWVFAGPDAKSTRNEPGLFEVKLWIKNYGKTPGFVKVIWARFSKDAPYDPVPKYEGAEKIQTELVLGTQEGFLWPKPFGTAFGERYFYGYIRYADIFKANQVSRFCVRLVPEEGRFEMAGSPAWNDHSTEE